ncbi:MAG: ribonuclease III domain-containing protein [Eubacteriales bacterium]|nr:ribonuclease III domain-containing protein [Eubacteriales bacterium]
MNGPITGDTYEISLRAVSENKIREFSPLNLAYIGDTVYDLYIRRYLVKNKMGRVEDLHKQASGVVNARAQAAAAKLLLPFLTEREKEIFRMGKNAKSTPPKNMSVDDYSQATGLEAVVGYLYLRDLTERTDELFRIIINHFFGEDTDA